MHKFGCIAGIIYHYLHLKNHDRTEDDCLCLHWILLVVYFQHSFLMPCYALIDMLSYAMIEINSMFCYYNVIIMF